MIDLILIFWGYLLGSIPFGLLVPKMYGIADIRKHGSGNIGATNVMRTLDVVPGLLVMAGDVGKGIAAVLAASILGGRLLAPEIICLLTGLAAVIGHIFPIFLKFKGGKGVNTALGVMIMLLPLAALSGLASFIVTVLISRYISLGSMIASLVFFAVVLAGYLTDFMNVPLSYLIVAAIIPVLIIGAHRSNIKRLVNGSENRFSLRAKHKEAGSHV